MSTPPLPPSGPPIPPGPPAPPPVYTAPRDASLADGEWHRMHPLTPLFKGGLVLIIVAGIVISNFRDRLIGWFIALFAPEGRNYYEVSGDPVDWVLQNNLVLLALLVVLVVLVVLIVAFWLAWRVHQFRIDHEHVEVRKGIVFRSQRRAPLDRVQGVNLTRPFPARLIGLAKLEVVGAGADANVPLEYLATAKAESVRADILRLASGARAAKAAARNPGGAAAAGAPLHGAAGAPPHGVDGLRHELVSGMSTGVTGLIEGVDLADVAPESVVKIPTGRLIGAHLLSGLLWLVFFAVIFGVAFAGAVFGILSEAQGTEATFGIIAVALGMGIPFLLVTVAITGGQITKSLRYSIAPTPDGVRITYGLFTTVTETIPPGRIFAVEVSQSALWRPFGWWLIKINRMSGKSAAEQQSTNQQQFNIVLPVGTRADVERVLRLILPDLPEADLPLVWQHGMLGPVGAEAGGDPYQSMAPRAWWRRPLSWKRHGFVLTDFALHMRRGVLWRKQAIMPLVRMQGLSVQQGPIDRLQKVGWMKAHSITGPILGEVVGIDSAALMVALEDMTTRTAAALRRDRGHRWAEAASDGAPGAAPDADAQPLPLPPGAPGPTWGTVPPPHLRPGAPQPPRIDLEDPRDA